MRILETDHYVMQIPEEWETEQDEETVVIYDEDEVSTIEITALVKEKGEVDEHELVDLSYAMTERGLEMQPVSVGDFTGQLFVHTDDDGAWREWYVAANDLILLISHGVEHENAGLDDAIVNEMLSTLLYKYTT